MAPARSARFRRWLQACLLLGLGLWIYGPSLRFAWVWDDVEGVTQNSLLRDPAALGKIWSGSDGPDYFPLTTSVEWLEWRLWGDDPLGYHAVSAGLHLVDALLFWLLLERLSGARPGAPGPWIGALLFLAHPVAVESVAWVSEVKNGLAEVLLLGSALAWVGWVEGGGKSTWRYGASLLLFLAALLAKTSVAMYPFALLLHLWWRRDRVRGPAVSPFFAASAGLGLVTLWFQGHRAIVAGHDYAGGAIERLANAGRALVFYLGKAILPIGLAPVYPRWGSGVGLSSAILAWLILCGLGLGFWLRRNGWGRAALLGLGFFALNLLPVCGLANMSYLRLSPVADHFAYVSLLGIAGLAGAGIGRLASAGGTRKRAVLAAALALVAALSFASRRYAEIFRDDLAFWTFAEARNPGAWIAHGNRGLALYRAGQAAAAEAEYREALRLKPDYGEAHANLAAVLADRGEFTEAVGEYERALPLIPDSAGMENNLGTALVRAGRLPEAVGHFEVAARLDPGNPEALHNLGNAMLLTGRFDEAVRAYEAAIALRPDDAAARSGLELARQALAGQNR